MAEKAWYDWISWFWQDLGRGAGGDSAGAATGEPRQPRDPFSALGTSLLLCVNRVLNIFNRE